MNQKNFVLEMHLDGENGGFTLNIKMRDGENFIEAATVTGYVGDDGTQPFLCLDMHAIARSFVQYPNRNTGTTDKETSVVVQTEY